MWICYPNGVLLDHHIRSKAFLYLESTLKKVRKKYVAKFFPSIRLFDRPDKNDVIKSKNCYKTSSVASFSSKQSKVAVFVN